MGSSEISHDAPLFDPSVQRRGYRITVLVDDPGAWIVPWAAALVECVRPFHQAALVHEAELIPEGDMCFLLGCLRRLPSELLQRHALNLVVHESGLPAGRGFAPIAWQVLEGRNRIPVCLLEAGPKVDAGPVYMRDAIDLDGNELLPEIRRKQGRKTLELCLRFLERWPDIRPQPQTGEPSWFRRRCREDDRFDPERSLSAQFDHLRIIDNEHYPAWFEHRGRRFILRIFPAEPQDSPC